MNLKSPKVISSLPNLSQQQQTYQEQLDERISTKHAFEIKERDIPLWMLQGFPALSNESDEDDSIDFE